MKTEEIRAMQLEQIRSKLSDAREELLKLRFQQVTGPVDRQQPSAHVCAAILPAWRQS